jgi:hypothetical protein
MLETEPDITVDQASQTIFSGGKRIELDDALIGFARRHAWSIAQSSREVRAEKDAKKNGGITAKDQLHGISQRVDFVRKFGQSAFEALPIRSAPQGDLLKLPPEELAKLPTREKVKIIKRVGEAQWSRMLRGTK